MQRSEQPYSQHFIERATKLWGLFLVITVIGSVSYAILRATGYSENAGFTLVTITTLLSLSPIMIIKDLVSSAYATMTMTTVSAVSSNTIAVATSPDVRGVVSDTLSYVIGTTQTPSFLPLFLYILALSIVYMVYRFAYLTHETNKWLKGNSVVIRVYKGFVFEGKVVEEKLVMERPAIRRTKFQTRDQDILQIVFKKAGDSMFIDIQTTGSYQDRMTRELGIDATWNPVQVEQLEIGPYRIEIRRNGDRFNVFE